MEKVLVVYFSFIPGQKALNYYISFYRSFLGLPNAYEFQFNQYKNLGFENKYFEDQNNKDEFF